MRIRISKESNVSITDQLAEEITFLIAAGELKAGEPLPSVRGLARRLKIHHNTVSRAYQELVTRRLLVRQAGKRLIVRSPGDVLEMGEVGDLDDLITNTIRQAQENGYTLSQLRRRVEERLFAQPPDHILVTSTDFGLRQLFREELRQELRHPVTPCDPGELCANPDLAMGALVVGAPGAIAQVAPTLPRTLQTIPVVVSPADEQVERIRALSKPSIVALVSISELLIQTERGFLAPVLGSRHTMREYLLPAESPGSLTAADLVIVDSITCRRIKHQNKTTYKVISPGCLAQIASAME